MSDDIGGFFVNLGVKVDNSIEKGIGKITDMTNSLSRLMGTVRNVSAASLALAGVTGAVEQEVANSAELLNTTSDVVKKWRFAVDEVSGGGKAFISTLTEIERKAQNIKLGKIDEGFATSLERLGINYMDFADMEVTERVKLIFDKASLIEDQDHAENIIKQLLGDAGQLFYINLQNQGIPIAQALENALKTAESHIFTDIESQSNAMMFNSEIKALKNMIGEISALTGSELGEVFTPMVKGINDFLEANNKLIASGIKDTFEDLRDILNQLSPTFDKVGGSLGEFVKALTNSDSVLEGLNKIKDGLFEFTKDFVNTSLTTFSDLVLMISAVLDGDWKKAGQYGKKFVQDFNDGVKEIVYTGEGDKRESLNILNNNLRGKKGEKQNYEDLSNSQKDMVKKYYYETKSLDGLEVKGIGEKELEEIKNYKPKIGAFDEKGNPIQSSTTYSDETWWEDRKINDGIVKPDGQVISISPDDWVFAMKDPSNLSKGINGIMPQNAIDPSFIKSVLPRIITGNTNTINENITVNQTFNVQGGSNIPQTIRQQAQKGVYDGVGELIQKSTTRLQLMSGIK